MHNKKIISKHKKIIDILKKHNENYFIYDNPKISDREYDEIKLEALTLEKYQYLKQYNSVENIVGAKPLNKFKKVKHLSPMLSL